MARITTAHAILRYLIRVQKVDISEIKRAMDRMGMEDKTDVAVVGFIADYTSIDLTRANEAVARPQIKTAAKAGASAVRINGVRYEIRDGSVVTVLTHRYNCGRRTFREYRKPKSWRPRAVREYREDHA